MAGRTTGEKVAKEVCKELGARVVRFDRSRRHLMFWVEAPHGDAVRIVAPRTPSCYRGRKNMRARVKRAMQGRM